MLIYVAVLLCLVPVVESVSGCFADCRTSYRRRLGSSDLSKCESWKFFENCLEGCSGGGQLIAEMHIDMASQMRELDRMCRKAGEAPIGSPRGLGRVGGLGSLESERLRSKLNRMRDAATSRIYDSDFDSFGATSRLGGLGSRHRSLLDDMGSRSSYSRTVIEEHGPSGYRREVYTGDGGGRSHVDRFKGRRPLHEDGLDGGGVRERDRYGVGDRGTGSIGGGSRGGSISRGGSRGSIRDDDRGSLRGDDNNDNGWSGGNTGDDRGSTFGGSTRDDDRGFGGSSGGRGSIRDDDGRGSQFGGDTGRDDDFNSFGGDSGRRGSFGGGSNHGSFGGGDSGIGGRRDSFGGGSQDGRPVKEEEVQGGTITQLYSGTQV